MKEYSIFTGQYYEQSGYPKVVITWRIKAFGYCYAPYVDPYDGGVYECRHTFERHKSPDVYMEEIDNKLMSFRLAI